MATDKLQDVLITGGDGFVGYNLIAKVLETEPTCKISVIDLPTTLPRSSSVKYYDVDISDKDAVMKAVREIRPKVVFHAACTYSLALPAETHSRINTQGTLNVLEAVRAVGTTKAFIYHSSTSVIEDGVSPIISATEDWPVLSAREQKFPYPLSKALAEQAVLAASRQSVMLTVSIRPAGGFGEADMENLAKTIEVAEGGKANIQIGDGTNVYDFCYIGNLVQAHLLAAKALLRASLYPKEVVERVDGEVFHITNDEPWLFWDYTREVAKQAGYEVKRENIRVLPRWFAMLIAFVAEWAVWILSGGKRESTLKRFGIRYACLTRTVSCEKAKRVLGYRPTVSMQEGIERSVKWFLDQKKTEVQSSVGP